jgi:two-component system cell cycle response regulator
MERRVYCRPTHEFWAAADYPDVELSGMQRTVLRALMAIAALALAAYAAHVLADLGGARFDWFFNDIVYNALLLGAALACLWRGVVWPRERAAWLLLGTGILSWLGGDLYWTFVLADMESPPYPSVGDLLYVLFYPCAYTALVLLVRSRVAEVSRSAWLDGAIAALAVGALVAALAFPAIVDVSSGNAAAVATNLAYPVGDLTLLGLVVVAFGLMRWRPGWAFLLLGMSLAIQALADGIYLFEVATDTYVEGDFVDLLWPAALLLTALAAWQRPTPTPAPRTGERRAVLVPPLGALTALLLVTYDHFVRIHDAALVLGALTLLLATVRMALAFSDNQQLLSHSREEALTDALTGLSNRRSLMLDLERATTDATDAEPLAVMLLDLDGFKLYNDTFGHPAGDALLCRLGGRLADAMEAHGRAYRLGGDEFCALVRTGSLGVAPLRGLAEAALTDFGEGFDVSASSGACMIPAEARTSSEALQLADRRMYARKGGDRASVTRQTRDVLLRALHEREPELHEHMHGVAELALEVGQRLQMTSEQLDELARASELHDIGKVAIPDAILNKPGPLTEEEWAFMRRHTLIGERILSAAPALRPVASIVRSSHERFDGSGYPDGRAGKEIPLGSRIVAACDAYHAMVSERPYRAARSPAEALAEIRHCSGSQFDPCVVDVLAEALERVGARAVEPTRA